MATVSPPVATMSDFAKTIYEQKYAFKDEEGNILEGWEDTAYRVALNVLGSLGYDETSPEFEKVFSYIRDRKFMPGGRYLYASGRPFHQVNNCLLMRAEDSREGWADLAQKAMMALMTGAGIGVDYSDLREEGAIIRKTGGESSGPLSLMHIINEIGRNVMQGGSRRSAIFASLRWSHPDVFKFIHLKDWSEEVRAMKEKDFNYPAPMDMTNISVTLDKDFFDAFEDESNPMYHHAHRVYRTTVDRMVRTAEPGFSVDYENARESLRNAPIAGNTYVLTRNGYKRVIKIVNQPQSIWTGVRWADDVVFSKTQENAPIVNVHFTGGREIRCEPTHEFLVERYVGAGKRKRLEKIEKIPAGSLVEGDILHVSLPELEVLYPLNKEMYTLGYTYGDGSFTKAGGAEISLCSKESKMLVSNIVGYNSKIDEDSRGYTRIYFGASEKWKNRSKQVVPVELYSESLPNLASFIAGLFDADGNFDKTQKRVRLSNNNPEFLRGIARILEDLGILASVSKNGVSTFGNKQTYQLSVMGEYIEEFSRIIPTKRIKIELEDWKPYRRSHLKVEKVSSDGFEDVYCADVKYPEHSFMAEGVIISNCTEITSEDDSDVCNLGSINLARVESIEELRDIVEYATLFLIAGTVYSHVPYERVAETREKNRRLGLGLMGIHEWLLKRGFKYGPNDELASWLDEYACSGQYAAKYAQIHGLSTPIKTRAIAPTGTIGIIGETTTGIEPIFCVAYKRRYLANGRNWKYQYVVDPTAQRLVDEGVNPNDIEDAYSLSYDVERRVAFQAWIQQWVDHGISSTINLPYPIEDEDEKLEFGNMLYGYLPKLRGTTVYPDGARGGQPLTPVSYDEAITQLGVVFEENEEKCVGGVCGL